MQRLENELHHYLSQPTMNVVEYTPTEKHTYVIGDPAPVTRDTTLLILGKFLHSYLCNVTRYPVLQHLRPYHRNLIQLFLVLLKISPESVMIFGEQLLRNSPNSIHYLNTDPPSFSTLYPFTFPLEI